MNIWRCALDYGSWISAGRTLTKTYNNDDRQTNAISEVTCPQMKGIQLLFIHDWIQKSVIDSTSDQRPEIKAFS